MIIPRSPYPLREFLGMSIRRFSAPPPFEQKAEKTIELTVNRVNEIKIGFVGDICPLRKRKAIFEKEIYRFFDDCSLMVGNFEGVITDEPHRPFLLKHSPAIFDVLESIKPIPNWTLSIANNHAMDYGDTALDQTISEFDRRGVNWLGTAGKPRAAVCEGITATAWSWWMNGETERICDTDPGAPQESGLHVALPHWGYEHEREPRPAQRKSIPRGYDMIAGHHSHLPQPMELTNNGIPIAWSLGNFLTAKSLPVLGEGALLKAVINRPDGEKPHIQSLHYRAIIINRDDPDYCRVSFR